jgi:hypothetical protein
MSYAELTSLLKLVYQENQENLQHDPIKHKNFEEQKQLAQSSTVCKVSDFDALTAI